MPLAKELQKHWWALAVTAVTVVASGSVSLYQIDNHEQRIEVLEEDHDMLIRIDENVKRLLKDAEDK